LVGFLLVRVARLIDGQLGLKEGGRAGCPFFETLFTLSFALGTVSIR
jgi:hypothetical protein